MAVPGGPSVAELGAAGVRRVSVGTTIAQAAYAAAQRAARDLLTDGRYEPEQLIGYPELDALFRR
jgi:2-methylisocitrate lyase-like PEP mutase family enzyme